MHIQSPEHTGGVALFSTPLSLQLKIQYHGLNTIHLFEVTKVIPLFSFIFLEIAHNTLVSLIHAYIEIEGWRNVSRYQRGVRIIPRYDISHNMIHSVDTKFDHTLVSSSSTNYMCNAQIENLLNYNESGKM